MSLPSSLIAAAAVIAAIPALACTRPTATQPELCTVHLPPVLSVHFNENAALAPAAEGWDEDCSHFRLNAAAVQRFFSHADSTDQRQAQQILGWSPCYASGTLKFADGREAAWSIHGYGTGTLAIVGGQGFYVYCPDCALSPSGSAKVGRPEAALASSGRSG